MQTTSYQRKPLKVEAVQVTEDNLYDVAKWCGGDVHTTLSSGKKYIEVAVLHPLHKKQTRASIGDWVLRSEQGFKIYADAAFQKGFEPAELTKGVDKSVAKALHVAFDDHSNGPQSMDTI
jgi:hypothetical protein